jgi:hypothetical protein
MVHRGKGLIRLGKIMSYGEWYILNGQLLVSFDSRSLSPEHRRVLEQYRECPDPLHLQLPGRDPVKARIIGFERKILEAVFYISQAKPSSTFPDMRIAQAVTP